MVVKGNPLICALVFILATSVVSAELYFPTTKKLREEMKPYYTVPKRLKPGKLSGLVCYQGSTYDPACIKINELCEKSKSKSCKEHNRFLRKAKAEWLNNFE